MDNSRSGWARTDIITDVINRRIDRRPWTIRAAAVLAAMLSVFALGGCGTTRAEMQPTARPTMTVSGAQRLMDAFDKRLAAVVKRAVSPAHDASGWASVAAHGMLASGRYQTWIFRAAGDRRPGATRHHTVRAVVARVESGGRQTLVLEGREVFHQPKGGDATARSVRYDALWVMERRSARGSWRLADDFSMDEADWPKPAAHTDRSASSAGHPVDPGAVVGAVVRALEHGGADLGGMSQIEKFQKHQHVADDIDDLYSCYPASAGPGTTTVPSAGPDVVSLRRDDGPLMLIRLRCDIDHWTRSGDTLIDVAAPQAKVDHEKRSTTHAAESFALSLLVSATKGGRPQVLALSADRVLRTGAPTPDAA